MSYNVQGQWHLKSASNIWGGRDGAGLLSIGDNLYMMGGWNTIWPAPFTTNEVWRSSNRGQTWAQLPNAPWERRHTSGWLEHGGKIWVIGGDMNSGHYQRDVWSFDGSSWTLATSNAEPLSQGRALHSVFSHLGKMWIVGGQTLDEFTPGDVSTKPGSTYYSDVWNSADGASWVKVSDNNAWTPRGLMIGSTVKDGHMWLIAGGAYDTEGQPRVYKNDVWKSADGVVWTLVGTAPFVARQYVGVPVLGDDLVMMAGWSGANRNDVWASPDGASWRELRGTPWGIRHALSVCPFKGEILILGGPLTDTSVWGLS